MSWKHRAYDLVLAPFVAAAGLPMRAARKVAISQLPRTRAALRRAGVFPIIDHYYEPLIDTENLRKGNPVRDLPGIDFALEGQTELLAQFKNLGPLESIPQTQTEPGAFFMDNGAFGAGDAEVWFHVIRHFRPARIIEVGSGHSTQMARLAIKANEAEDPAYSCDHLCIEPYEMPWLEDLGVRVLRQRLEDTDPALFDTLGTDDILFIDSSHIIRPQGDVLREYLQIIPRLRPGVLVHVHDIFSPRDYPMEWLEFPRFWNEQYLLEAFLSHNDAWEVLLSLNLLKHERYEEFKAVAPYLHEGREPGSFYMRRL